MHPMYIYYSPFSLITCITLFLGNSPINIVSTFKLTNHKTVYTQMDLDIRSMSLLEVSLMIKMVKTISNPCFFDLFMKAHKDYLRQSNNINLMLKSLIIIYTISLTATQQSGTFRSGYMTFFTKAYL